jgi:hypothetical protein
MMMALNISVKSTVKVKRMDMESTNQRMVLSKMENGKMMYSSLIETKGANSQKLLFR